MQKLIIFLIRRRLGLRKYQYFRFKNQKSKDIYYFTQEYLIKQIVKNNRTEKHGTLSGASLNWLLNPECKVAKLSE